MWLFDILSVPVKKLLLYLYAFYWRSYEASLKAIAFLFYRMSVALGGGEYWTDKMAEFTGKPHRVVFNDTMEKIYSRLYTNASSSSSPKKGSLD